MKCPILPMLATTSQPFDSSEHLFEIKWDGVRALAAVEEGHWRLWGRELADYSGRYPELDVLRRLPSGTIVDGELVVFKDGHCDLNAILGRHQLVNPMRVRFASQTPVRYVLFDLLVHQGRCLMNEPLFRRRAALTDVMTNLGDTPGLMFSEGVVGLGQDFFERVVGQGHEGVMAKHLASRYQPGKRSSSWRKLKPAEVLPCVIIGYVPSRSGIHSLLVATVHDGVCRYVGEIASGFTDAMKADLGRRLAQIQRHEPAVLCPRKARWVEPTLYCRVRFLAWTPNGYLRGASFKGLMDDGAHTCQTP
jgi:DNA ligase D-like protein (predicted ligase)